VLAILECLKFLKLKACQSELPLISSISPGLEKNIHHLKLCKHFLLGDSKIKICTIESIPA